MLYFVVGLPGAFTEWCGAVVAELANRGAGRTTMIEANTLGDISRAILRGGASQAVISAPAPGGRLRSALVAAARPFVITLDDPRLACADLVLGKQCTLATAVRQVASSCSAIMGLRSVPSALVLHADRDWSESMAARALSGHFGFAVHDHELGDILDGINRNNPASRDYDVSAWWNGLAPPEKELMRGALDPYFGHSASGRALSIAWAPELFSLGERPGEPASAAIDITGRARCLMQGPYVLLPPGNWSLVLTLGFSREATDHEFLVEIVTDRQLASANLKPHHEGDLTAELAFVIDESTDHPITIRVSTRRAAFDGLVILRGAALLRQPEGGTSDAPGATPDA